MPAVFRHFAINADDVPRAKRFYEAVFGWTFDPWGPPDFYQIRNAGEGLLGALQGRRELKPGARMTGFEPTLGVEDLKATIAAVEANGGRLLMPPYRIEGVGELAFFEDTEGNFVGAMQYEPGVFAP
jgi:predicted enzyme related to lactoylglutathione lyase